MPRWAASDRVDQRPPFGARSFRVAARTRRSCFDATLRGRPDRGRSVATPASPPAMNRRRHRPTVWASNSSIAAIRASGHPRARRSRRAARRARRGRVESPRQRCRVRRWAEVRRRKGAVLIGLSILPNFSAKRKHGPLRSSEPRPRLAHSDSPAAGLGMPLRRVPSMDKSAAAAVRTALPTKKRARRGS